MPEAKVADQGESRFSSQPTGYLLGKFGLLAILAGLVLAAWYGQVIIVILLGLVLATAGLSKLWSRFSLAGVSCQRQLSERRVFPGEHIELRLRLVNRKLLPLPWIQVDDEMPLKFSADVPLSPGSKPGFGFLSKGAALLWYTGVSWKQRLNCDRRGYYPLGPITLTSGDIFGFYPRSITESLVDHVIVYPKVFPIDQLGIPSLYPIGETTAERRIFEDPTRVIGVRDYSPGDSRRRIHWKASARHQNLQVKVFVNQDPAFREWLVDIVKNDQEFIEWRYAALRVLWEMKDGAPVVETYNDLLDWTEATIKSAKGDNWYVRHEIRSHISYQILSLPTTEVGPEALDIIKRVAPVRWKRVLTGATERKAVTSEEMDSPGEKEMLKLWATNARKLLELASQETPSSPEE